MNLPTEPPRFESEAQAILWLAGRFRDEYLRQPRGAPRLVFELLLQNLLAGNCRQGEPLRRQDILRQINGSDGTFSTEDVKAALRQIAVRFAYFGKSGSIHEALRAYTENSHHRSPDLAQATVCIRGTKVAIEIFGPGEKRDGHYLRVQYLPADRPADPTTQDDDTLGDYPPHETASRSARSQNRFDAAWKNLNPAVAAGIRLNARVEIIATAWQALTSDILFASDVAARPGPDDLVRAVLKPILGVGKREPVRPEDLTDAFGALASVARTDGHALHAIERLRRRLLHYSFRRQPDLLSVPAAAQLLRAASTSTHSSWHDMLADLAMQSLSRRTSYDETTRSILDAALASQESEDADRQPPLLRLRPFIETPLKILREFSYDETIATLASIAAQCARAPEAYWCIRAFRKVVPLYDIHEDASSIATAFEELLKVVNPTVPRTSYYRVQRLHNRLLIFLGKRVHVSELGAFEKQLLANWTGIVPGHLLFLQIEYAACLYMAAEYGLNTDALLFSREIALGRSPLTHGPLRTNIFRSEEFGLPRQDASDILRWLDRYVGRAFRLHLPLIEDHILEVDRFRCATMLPSVRQTLREHLRAPVRAIAMGANSDDEAAETISLYRFLNPTAERDAQTAHLRRGIRAGDEPVLRNLRPMLIAAHKAAIYLDDSPAQAEARAIADKLYALGRHVRPGGDFRYSDFWFLSIHFSERQEDIAFTRAFSLEIQHERRLASPFTPSLDAEMHRLPATLNAKLASFTTRSLLAKGLAKYAANSEAWNLIATSIVRAVPDSERDRQLFLTAATFYAIAGMIARMNHEFDQTPTFNYISSLSRATLHGHPFDTEFVASSARYLLDPRAKHFRFWADRTKAFFEVIQRAWPTLSDAQKSRLDGPLSRLLASREPGTGLLLPLLRPGTGPR